MGTLEDYVLNIIIGIVVSLFTIISVAIGVYRSLMKTIYDLNNNQEKRIREWSSNKFVQKDDLDDLKQELYKLTALEEANVKVMSQIQKTTDKVEEELKRLADDVKELYRNKQ